jgi:hypothetical protein
MTENVRCDAPAGGYRSASLHVTTNSRFGYTPVVAVHTPGARVKRSSQKGMSTPAGIEALGMHTLLYAFVGVDPMPIMPFEPTHA